MRFSALLIGAIGVEFAVAKAAREDPAVGEDPGEAVATANREAEAAVAVRVEYHAHTRSSYLSGESG